MKEIVHFELEASKSLYNRYLILNYLFPNQLYLENESSANDVIVMQKALDFIGKNTSGTIDIEHCGTAMRFLTALLCTEKDKEFILTGSERMKQRPISILVDALRSLGAKISYENREGFPPIRIIGSEFTSNSVEIEGSVSSQYSTSMLLIGSSLPNGLCIDIKNKLTSKPYVDMTIQLMKSIGIEVHSHENRIEVKHKNKISSHKIYVESDWSSASYIYQLQTLFPEKEFVISHFTSESWQGDKRVSEIYKDFFGVETHFEQDYIHLKFNKNFQKKIIQIDVEDCPDLAQTIAVTALIHKIPIEITGLQTLTIKETNRIVALQNELTKCNAEVTCTSDSLSIKSFGEIPSNISIETYNDHRMAMAFAPLEFLFQAKIQDKKVVHKSYPNFWNDFQKAIS